MPIWQEVSNKSYSYLYLTWMATFIFDRMECPRICNVRGLCDVILGTLDGSWGNGQDQIAISSDAFLNVISAPLSETIWINSFAHFSDVLPSILRNNASVIT